ncbi:MAG: tetratricopeptide repeat protein [Saprospiraceae bacterium]
MNRKFQLEELLKESPKNSFLLFALAKECELEDDYLKAIDWYTTLLANEPEYTGAYYHLAAAYRRLNQIDECRKILQSGIIQCTNQGKQHDLSELKSALMNLEIELLEG